MQHPMVRQLRFARSEFRRGLALLSDADARVRVGPANSIAWNVGHLAWQEQRYWVKRIGELEPVAPMLDESFCFGCPPTDANLGEMWATWELVIETADPILDSFTTADLARIRRHGEREYTAGDLLNRTIFHYWFHLGESMGLRQAMGHRELPQFVGDLEGHAPFEAF